MSGWICEDVWNHIETLGLLDTLMYSFGDHEEALLREERDLSQDTVSFLRVWRVMWLRLCSATLHSLRRGTAVSCTQQECDADEGLLHRTNVQIEHEQRLYKYDIEALAAMYEIQVRRGMFPKSILSSNLHTAVCRVPREMQRHGATKLELGMERSASILIACLPASAYLPACV